MTDRFDFWMHVLTGGGVDGDDKLPLRTVETVARELYDAATLDWPINGAPAPVVEAAEEAVTKATECMAALVKLAEVSRRELEQRDGPFAVPAGAPREIPEGHRLCETCGGTGAVKETDPADPKRVLSVEPCEDCDGVGLQPIDGWAGDFPPGSPGDIARRSVHRPR